MYIFTAHNISGKRVSQFAVADKKEIIETLRILNESDRVHYFEIFGADGFVLSLYDEFGVGHVEKFRAGVQRV